MKGYGDRLLIDDLSFLLPPGGIVGVIGPNGAGKTTLFRMIVGEDKPDCGTLQVGDTVELACVDQTREDLDPETTVFQEITGGLEQHRRRQSRAARPGLCVELRFQGAATSKRRSVSCLAANATGSSSPRC